MSAGTQAELFPLPEPPEPVCRLCRGRAFTVRWQEFADGTKHLRQECAGCGAFAGYENQQRRELPGQAPDAQAAVAQDGGPK